MGMPERCARRPGLCEPWGRVYCSPMPGEVTRMIALTGQMCDLACPDGVWRRSLCYNGEGGSCTQRWCAHGCRCLGDSMPALPPCAWHDQSWGSLANLAETRRRWRELPQCFFSHSGWHECLR